MKRLVLIPFLIFIILPGILVAESNNELIYSDSVQLNNDSLDEKKNHITLDADFILYFPVFTFARRVDDKYSIGGGFGLGILGALAAENGGIVSWNYTLFAPDYIKEQSLFFKNDHGIGSVFHLDAFVRYHITHRTQLDFGIRYGLIAWSEPDPAYQDTFYYQGGMMGSQIVGAHIGIFTGKKKLQIGTRLIASKTVSFPWPSDANPDDFILYWTPIILRYNISF